ncbi:unnamed protein product [Paramecium sonneborni]|uniref:Uncharacterized protein n=1 Tax=Paramecium sonneborni TaxID=65129 RepID=A0A8S1NVP7_9CILI|nr:unnamed protein product [Paramecium sonneborni]
MSHQLSNIEKIKQYLHLQQQVKEILTKEYINLQNKEHFKVLIDIMEKPEKKKEHRWNYSSYKQCFHQQNIFKK